MSHTILLQGESAAVLINMQVLHRRIESTMTILDVDFQTALEMVVAATKLPMEGKHTNCRSVLKFKEQPKGSN